jgi:hypothetical protein
MPRARADMPAYVSADTCLLQPQVVSSSQFFEILHCGTSNNWSKTRDDYTKFNLLVLVVMAVMANAAAHHVAVDRHSKDESDSQ